MKAGTRDVLGKGATLPGGYSWVFLVGVCHPVLQILTLFQTKIVIFHTRLQICKKLCHDYSDNNSSKQCFLKFTLNSHISLFFLLILNSNDKIRSYTPVVPSKTITDSRQNGQNIYPFSDQNGAKTVPLGSAQTYMAYTRENPPPGGGNFPLSLLFLPITPRSHSTFIPIIFHSCFSLLSSSPLSLGKAGLWRRQHYQYKFVRLTKRLRGGSDRLYLQVNAYLILR